MTPLVIAGEGQRWLTWNEVPGHQRVAFDHECSALGRSVNIYLKRVALRERGAFVARCAACNNVWWRGDRAVAERSIELGVR